MIRTLQQWQQKPPLGVPINRGHQDAKDWFAWWLLNEHGGNKTYDSTGNMGAGTLTGLTIPGCWNGEAVNFDGTSGYILVPFSPLFNGLTQITMHARVMQTTAGTTYAIFSRPNDDLSFALWHYSTNMEVMIKTATGTLRMVTAYTLPLNMPTDVTGVYDGQNVHLYIDGVWMNSGAKTGTISTNGTQPLYIGHDPDFGATFKGQIFHAGIAPVALSPSRIMGLHARPYAMFDQQRVWAVGAGAVLNLTPGVINIIAGVAAAGVTVAIPPAVIDVRAETGDVWRYDGVSLYTNTGQAPVYTQADSFSWAGWLKTTEAGNNKIFVGSYRTGATVSRVYLNHSTTYPGKLVCAVTDVNALGTTTLRTVANVNDGAWRHVALVRDRASDTVKLYLDAVVASVADATTGDINLTGSPMFIGCADLNGGPSGYASCAWDGIASWNVALTLAQVQALAVSRTVHPIGVLPGNIVYNAHIGEPTLGVTILPSAIDILATALSASPGVSLSIAAPVNIAAAVLSPGLAVNLLPLQVDVLVATQTPGKTMTLSANRIDIAAAVEAACPTIILSANVQNVQALAHAIGVTLGLNPAAINVTVAPQHPTIPGLAATRTIIITVRGARS